MHAWFLRIVRSCGQTRTTIRESTDADARSRADHGEMIVLGAGAPHLDVTRVVILDRRGFDRFALEILCEQAPGVTVAASVANVSEAVGVLARAGAVVLAGRQALLVEGPEPTARLRAAGAERVIMVGTGDRDWIRAEAIRVDADGFLVRNGDGILQAWILHGEAETVPLWRDEPAGGAPPL
jgi:hypothetical protein